MSFFLRNVVTALALASCAHTSPMPGIGFEERATDASNSNISAFIAKERAIALQGIIDNIGPDGRYSQGAASGVVIASPSTVNPDYLYTWTRDSALTMKAIVDEFIAGNKGLEKIIKNYVKAVAITQTLTNPSGNFYTGSGLGEPKFLVDIEPFLGAWGRPQRDGPALRAVALMSYIEYLISTGQSSQATRVVWPVVANDLAYVGQYWNQTGFDLWEEVSGSSFFTVQNQYRALLQGGFIARLLRQQCHACSSEAPQLLCFLQSFWNGTSVIANINTQTKRSGIDVNSLLGAISVFDIAGSCTDGTFQPCNSKILASHKVLVDSFRGIYGVNAGRTTGKALACGRYSVDEYYGGNPWYLATLAAAEVLYDAIAQWKVQRQLKVDNISLKFFQDLYPSVKAQTYSSKSRDFIGIVNAVQIYADGFVDIVRQYLPANGSISEQFQRDQGYPLSAYALTWSYVSFITMSQRRSGYYPFTWGSRAGSPIPLKCQGTSAKGTYAPATAAGAPNITNTCTNPITFAVNASTYYGENLYLESNTTDLGNWNPRNSYGMQASNYTAERHLWFIEVQLPADKHISYNYFRVESDGSYIFEQTNRTITVPGCGKGGLTTNDAWIGTCSTAPNCT